MCVCSVGSRRRHLSVAVAMATRSTDKVLHTYGPRIHTLGKGGYLPTTRILVLVHTRCSTHKRSFQHFLSGAGRARRSPSLSRSRFPSFRLYCSPLVGRRLGRSEICFFVHYSRGKTFGAHARAAKSDARLHLASASVSIGGAPAFQSRSEKQNNKRC